jgi:hypothetical protein
MLMNGEVELDRVFSCLSTSSDFNRSAQDSIKKRTCNITLADLVITIGSVFIASRSINAGFAPIICLCHSLREYFRRQTDA